MNYKFIYNVSDKFARKRDVIDSAPTLDEDQFYFGNFQFVEDEEKKEKRYTCPWPIWDKMSCRCYTIEGDAQCIE